MTSKLELLLQEKARLSAYQPPDLLSACFDKQLQVVDAILNKKQRRIALLIARRSGKTYLEVILMLFVCLNQPATKCLYFGLTASSAWETIFLHMIEPLCRQYNIPFATNRTLKTVSFENQSYIKITGDDANDKQIDVALGSKYALSIFDEAQSITHDMRPWIDKIAPAMVDVDGTIIVSGTSGDRMGTNLWYKISTNQVPGWEIFSWTRFDNPYTTNQVSKYLETKLIEDPTFEQSPEFQQQWMCKWITETEGRIYKYNPAINALHDDKVIKSLLLPDPKWSYILAVDPGFEDDTAFVVLAYYKHDPNLYVVESYKKKHLHATAMAEEIKTLNYKYRFKSIVVDGANKQVVEELRQVHRLPLIAADKRRKQAHWALMNADFRTGRIQVIEKFNQEIIKEWNELIYDERNRLIGILKENPTKENHAADACLYGFFFSRHYRATPEPKPEFSTFRAQVEKELLDNNAAKSHYSYGDTPGSADDFYGSFGIK